MTGARNPLPRLDVDLIPHETELRAPVVELHEGVLRLVEEDRLLRELGERAELQYERADLGGIGPDALRLARLQVHEHVRQAGRRVESGQEPRPEILGQPQQPLVSRHLIAREESPE